MRCVRITLSGITRESRVLCSKFCSAGGMMLKLCHTKMRTIAKTHFYAHTDPIFRNLGILKFHDIHLLQLGLFMYSYQNRALPLKFDCKFTLQKEIHSYHTRNSHLYRLPFCRTNIKQFSVFYQGPKFYNSLSTEIVNSSSSVSFKKALKAFFCNNYWR